MYYPKKFYTWRSLTFVQKCRRKLFTVDLTLASNSIFLLNMYEYEYHQGLLMRFYYVYFSLIPREIKQIDTAFPGSNIPLQ